MVERVLKIENAKRYQRKNEYYDGVFTKPSSVNIRNYPLPLDLKAPKCKIFSGEQDPK